MRYIIRLFAAAWSAVAVFSGGPAQAQKRVALVIGNADYKVGRLANPVNDAAAVAEALQKQLKFDTVLLRRNLALDGFRAALREMASATRGAEMGVVFFAGHGIELGGRNYLIPTDAGLTSSADIDLEAIALDTVLRQLEGVTRLRLVILDACRNNPFPAGMRSVRGLGRIEPDLGTLVAYAAKNGTVADDGKGQHSPFTAALLKRIVAPGLDVRRVFGYVSEDVMAATSRKQEPYLYGRLGGDEVYLNPQAPTGPAPQPAAPAALAGDAERAWVAAKDTTSITVLEDLIARYRDTFYAGLARARIDELKRQQVAVVTPAEKVTPTTKPLEVKPLPIMSPKVVEPSAAISPLRTRAPAPLTQAEQRALKPKDSFQECDTCPEMVVVPAGTFTMGSPKDEHQQFEVLFADAEKQSPVKISKAFAVGRFAVTRGEFAVFVAATGHKTDGGCWDYFYNTVDKKRPDISWRSPGFLQNDRHPVVCVNWHDAKAYVKWLSTKAGRSYRLLSEVEREYVTRAGTTTPFWWGSTISPSQANYNGCCGGTTKGTVAVDTFEPNPWGLYNVHGNVGEWTEDCPRGKNAGDSPGDGRVRVGGDCAYRTVRGGSWYVVPKGLRSAHNGSDFPGHRSFAYGFRVARTLSP